MANISVNVSDEMFTMFEAKCEALDMSSAALARSYIAEAIGYDLAAEDAAKEAIKAEEKAAREAGKQLTDLIAKTIRESKGLTIEEIVAKIKADNPTLQ